MVDFGYSCRRAQVCIVNFGVNRMNRRTLLKGSFAMLAFSKTMPALSLEGAEAFSEELYQEVLASGKPFMLDFTASW